MPSSARRNLLMAINGNPAHGFHSFMDTSLTTMLEIIASNLTDKRFVHTDFLEDRDCYTPENSTIIVSSDKSTGIWLRGSSYIMTNDHDDSARNPLVLLQHNLITANMLQIGIAAHRATQHNAPVSILETIIVSPYFCRYFLSTVVSLLKVDATKRLVLDLSWTRQRPPQDSLKLLGQYFATETCSLTELCLTGLDNVSFLKACTCLSEITTPTPTLLKLCIGNCTAPHARAIQDPLPDCVLQMFEKNRIAHAVQHLEISTVTFNPSFMKSLISVCQTSQSALQLSLHGFYNPSIKTQITTPIPSMSVRLDPPNHLLSMPLNDFTEKGKLSISQSLQKLLILIHGKWLQPLSSIYENMVQDHLDAVKKNLVCWTDRTPNGLHVSCYVCKCWSGIQHRKCLGCGTPFSSTGRYIGTFSNGILKKVTKNDIDTTKSISHEMRNAVVITMSLDEAAMVRKTMKQMATARKVECDFMDTIDRLETNLLYDFMANAGKDLCKHP